MVPSMLNRISEKEYNSKLTGFKKKTPPIHTSVDDQIRNQKGNPNKMRVVFIQDSLEVSQ